MSKSSIEETQIDELLVTVPKGSVKMRDDRTKEDWETEVPAFRMSKFPVTQDLYASLSSENPSTFIGEKLPVETVTWIDAVIFVISYLNP